MPRSELAVAPTGPGLSESARVTSAAESRFRIAGPNSWPRTTGVLALDRGSDEIVSRLTTQAWVRAAFLSAVVADAGPVTFQDFHGRSRDLVADLAGVDAVVMVATPGGPTAAAEVIARVCRPRGVLTTVLLVSDSAAGADDVRAALGALRPHADMLVTASSRDYLGAMLAALRA